MEDNSKPNQPGGLSPSPPTEGGEGRGEEARFSWACPSPPSSPHSFLAGRGSQSNRLGKRFVSFFTALFLGAFACSGAGLQQPPPLPLTNAPRLSPLLVDDTGRPISNPSDWQRQREMLTQEWLRFMGELPRDKAPLKPEFLEKEVLPGFTRQKVKYQIEEGHFTDAILLVPDNAKGKLSAIVVFHPTYPKFYARVAGLEPAEEERQHALHLVKRGYVVLCPRCYIYEDGADMKGNVARVQQRHPNWTGMARMTWDGVRAVDFLESLPNVDTKRIGGFGHSLGAKEVLYAAAFDERYKVAVSSEGGIGLGFSNWEAVWYLGPRIRQPGFALENHQVLALIAPRAFLLLAGESADSDRSWAFIDAARPVYQLLGAPQNIGWLNHRKGHSYPTEARAIAEEFLDRHLK
ncbi:MAG: dienelactone hydrolase family protein [Verrucomicrobia bacterium]|nr:dienelactone hydrolase family protein [Verrucomicrobiota bacterium]